MERRRKILLLHGDGAEPDAAELQALWQRALHGGLLRDRPKAADRLEQVEIEMFCYADRLDTAADGKDAALLRAETLEQLLSRKKSRDFRRRHYDELPGKTAVPEFAMDVAASVGLGKHLIGRKLPNMVRYWTDEAWGKPLADDVLGWLAQHLDNSEVFVVSHCFGSVLAYDGLWRYSHEGEPRGRVSHLLTLGSPLASNAVRRKLQGAKHSGVERYPSVIAHWHNISAEDDPICHDKTAADDYADMLKHELIESISDHPMYNLSLHDGASDPHNALGYLVHPRTVELLADWLT